MALDALQERLGYAFRDEGLLVQALTHPSYANERRTASNQRLEFLGDAVLELSASDALYRRFPEVGEGQLTRLRASAVQEHSLSELARGLGVGPCLLLGRGELLSGGADRASVLEDAFEAILGAVYLDGGWEAARQTAVRLLGERLGTLQFSQSADYKTCFQEHAQRHGPVDIAYRVLEATGPDHDRHYRVELSVAGRAVAQGEGRNKKEAEQQAARQALLDAGVDTEELDR